VKYPVWNEMQLQERKQYQRVTGGNEDEAHVQADHRT
jgi:hypothetical protein